MAIVVVALASTGCSMTLPVRGTMANGGETFVGSATGYSDGGGTLEIRSSRGLTCSGNFVYETARRRSGVFTCSNGQSGPFQFLSTGAHGMGTGTIGGRYFVFTFG